MPIVAVNVVKVALTICLFGFLFYVARSMRGHVVGPPTESPTPASPTRAPGDDEPPSAPRSLRLTVTEPGGRERTIEVTRRIVVGRGATADVTIDDDYASEEHAAFEPDGDHVCVEDLGSTNGTTVGEGKIRERTRLDRGATVEIGRTKVVAT